MSKYTNKVIELFAKNHLSKSSQKEFHEWLIDSDQQKEKEEALFHLWNQPNNITKAETLKSLKQLKAKAGIRNNNNNHIILWRYAVAIVLLISITTAYILTNNKPDELNFVEHYSPIGKIDTVTLPDGSVVQTNSSTILVYPNNFGKESRTLYLTGEAFFKVQKNKEIPFIVKSKNFSITALGTEFNVASYPDDEIFSTTLVTGSVKVEKNGELSEHILNIGEQFSYNHKTANLAVTTIDLNDATAWTRGELVFRGSTIKEITKILERKYDVTFYNKTLTEDNDKYNFRFKKEAPFTEVMNTIKNVAYDLNYKIVDDACYIY